MRFNGSVVFNPGATLTVCFGVETVSNYGDDYLDIYDLRKGVFAVTHGCKFCLKGMLLSYNGYYVCASLALRVNSLSLAAPFDFGSVLNERFSRLSYNSSLC